MDLLTPKSRVWVCFMALIGGMLCHFPPAAVAETHGGDVGWPVFTEERVAQVFSPGELTSVHAEWDSLRYCSSCHASQNQVDPDLCLHCHGVLEARIKAKEGFHSSASARGQSCESCHAEHAGRDAPTIQWPKGQKSLFPHGQTGWPLKGAHKKEDCAACHETRRIQSKQVLARLEKHPQKKTFLGLDEDCLTCHFDEHREALGQDCLSCHNEAQWKPAPGFDHSEHWTLRGAHGRAECVACHARAEDTTTAKSAFPTPIEWSYLTFEEMAHEDCTDCHEDPHQRRFGERCLDCHTNDSWDAKKIKDELAFHNKTRYPLEGEHRDVSCDSCHPTVRGKKRLRPIPFEQCTDCHPNAHPEVPLEDMTEGCEACHTVDGFAPASFTVDAHAQTDFPLNGAHLAVSCQECHTSALGEAVELPKRPRRVKGKLARLLRSAWHLRTADNTEDCASCHATPHREQFTDPSCAACHTTGDWQMAVDFDHSKLTDYPLEGRHEAVDCALCHTTETDDIGPFVRYAPVESGTCEACHADVHYGQFDEIDPKLACADCHQVEGFEALRFEHNEASFSDFPLRGAHEAADCQACHLDVSLSPKITLTGFRPLPSECGQCHEDNHQGAYQKAGELVASQTVAMAIPTAPWGLPSRWTGPHESELTSCASCHVEENWYDLSFDHDLTRFPLKGGHDKTNCEACHTGARPEQPPMDCAFCHQDVHRGTLGSTCEDCHSELSFNQPERMLARHAQTSFPLTGQHAVVPCTECHADVRDLSFTDAPSDCAACHAQEAPAPGASTLDHTGLTDCQSCHTPLAWKDGAFVDHERCFPIRPGSNHAQVGCQECHSAVPSVLTTCDSGTAKCVDCHGCEADEHDDVRGYECEDQKCYSCHPSGSE